MVTFTGIEVEGMAGGDMMIGCVLRMFPCLQFVSYNVIVFILFLIPIPQVDVSSKVFHGLSIRVYTYFFYVLSYMHFESLQLCLNTHWIHWE